jgi:guanyl-specific ribonuclease Sa
MQALQRFSTRAWLFFFCALWWTGFSGIEIQGQEARFATGLVREPATGVPEQARQVLEAIQARSGKPLPGYVGGREFHNRERRLPTGHYREYDVNPKLPGRPRDAARIVIEQRTQKAYYSPDHYHTFLPLN